MRALEFMGERWSRWEPLPGIIRAWDAADLDMQDWGDPFGAAVGACIDLASLMVGWESPEWGNIGGRWDVSLGIGGLTDEHWEALAECLADENDTAWESVWDVREGEHQGVCIPGLFRYLSESEAHLADVVRLGDLLADIVDQCKTLGKDY